MKEDILKIKKYLEKKKIIDKWIFDYCLDYDANTGNSSKVQKFSMNEDYSVDMYIAGTTLGICDESIDELPIEINSIKFGTVRHNKAFIETMPNTISLVHTKIRTTKGFPKNVEILTYQNQWFILDPHSPDVVCHIVSSTGIVKVIDKPSSSQVSVQLQVSGIYKKLLQHYRSLKETIRKVGSLMSIFPNKEGHQ